MSSQEIYISTDIEVDGPIPGPHSMLSLGSAAFAANGEILSTFSANLTKLPEAKGHPKTMKWWEGQPEAWAICRTNLQEPKVAMHQYAIWLNQLPGKPIFAGYPAAFDFMFVYWYLMKFVGESPLGHSAIDIRTYSMAILGKPYQQSGKSNMPKHWLDDDPHTHIALDDAIKQGRIFCRILKEKPQNITP